MAIAVGISTAVTVSGAAAAAPATVPTRDSSLSALTVTGSEMTSLAPAFAAGTHVYQVVTNDSATADVTATPAGSGAAVVVSERGTTIPVSGGVASAPLVRGRNDIDLTVTSSDRTSSTSYRVTVWRNVAPTPTVVALAPVVTPAEGGARFEAQLADGALPGECRRTITVRGNQQDTVGQTFDPLTGLTHMTASTPDLTDRSAGRADLVIITGCSPPGGGFSSTVTVPDAVTILNGLSVTAYDVPATITEGSVMRISGPGISYDSNLYGWLEDADGSQYELSRWGWTGTDQTEFYLDYHYEESFFMRDRPLTFHVGYWNSPAGRYVSEFSKPVSFVHPAPAMLTFSPTSGSVAGDSTFLLRGRFIYSGVEYLTIRVGGRVASYRYVSAASYQSDYHDYLTALDVMRVTVPAGVAPGLVPVTVETEYGETTAAGLFRYVARPRVDSIAPASVARSGGSVITVAGSSFGTAGTPSVVIGGIKSPQVNRISDARLTAVVPASTSTGPVPVTVSSAQGGGVSAAVDLTLTAPGTAPVISRVTPAAAMVGDEVTITGTNLGAAGTAGVAFGDAWAIPAASSPTSITVAVPATGASGIQNITVGTPTGAATATGGFRVLAQPAITAVSPVSIPSYATGASARITLTGAGFGTTGTVKVGSAAPVAYTATLSGSRISGVVVPTTTAGAVPIFVTPRGSQTALRATVRVVPPAITYVGPDPYSADYGPTSISGAANMTYQISAAGGSGVRIQGSGFGPRGVLTLAGRPVATTSWSDTAITFTAPARPAGPVSVGVSPANSPISATRAAGLRYILAVVGLPTIGRIASVADNGYASRTEFDQVADASAQFTLTGQNLAGTTASATRVVIGNGRDTYTLVPTAVTATSLTFGAPRTFTTTGEWKTVQVITNVGSFMVEHGVYYRSDGIQVGIAPTTGYCGRTATSASGSVTYTPATASITASSAVFGTAGTATVDGVALGTANWSSTQVDVDFAGLTTALSAPWGTKTLVVTPTDTSLPARRVLFTCGVTPTVTTTINGATTAVTVVAGTSITLGATTAGFIGPFSVTAPAGYEYVTDATYQSTGFSENVRSGVPSAAGDYWVRVALPRATYDRTPYLPFSATPAHLTITGRPVTVTAVSDLGGSTLYQGQLDAGTSTSPGDFHYTATSTADPITKVYYEYRDAVCAGQGPDAGWHDGLPSSVAIEDPACGGDGTTHSTWQVRVKSFEMTANGVDRAGYYLPTFPITSIDITPKPITVTSLRADKVWDGTDTASLGTPAVTGAVSGDTVILDGTSTGTFADAAVGVDKPVTLAQDLVLDGTAASNYTLTNPRPVVLGTISKAPAELALTASTSTVLLSQNTPVTITPIVTDARTGNPPDSTAGVAPVVLVSRTTSICTISDTTVTAVSAGTCVIAGTEATSANYQAATAVSDPSSTTETVEIQIFAAQQTISVLADDLTVADGDSVNPTAQVSGLFDGDSLDGVDYDYYDGSTRLPGVPTAVGTYTIMPKDGTLHAATTAVYSNPTSFTYVPGRLTITPAPPEITGMTPRTGTIFGGNPVTITGTRLDTVQTVKIGSVTLTGGDFTVNGDGTQLTFTAPATPTAGPADVLLTAGTASASDLYTYLATVPRVPRAVEVTGSGTSLTVRFAPPVHDGGSPITAYHISITGGRTWLTQPLSCPGGVCTTALTGLVTAHTYPVVVRAVNEVGPGPWSAAETGYTNPVWRPVVPSTPGQVAVPANPDAYQGPRRFTTALYTTYAGRPAAPIASLGAHQMVSGEAVTTLRGELFAFDSAELTAAGRAAVRTVAQHLRLAHRVTCEGYTDYAGQADHERELSLARARIICQTLVAYGAHVTTTAYGYGGARPVIVGGTPQSRAENRRVVIRVDA